MRTTLTLDDRLATALKKRAAETGKTFKQIVNETLRAGLERSGAAPAARPYRVKPVALGQARSDVDLDKALSLAGELEDAELAAKMERRK